MEKRKYVNSLSVSMCLLVSVWPSTSIPDHDSLARLTYALSTHRNTKNTQSASGKRLENNDVAPKAFDVHPSASGDHVALVYSRSHATGSACLKRIDIIACAVSLQLSALFGLGYSERDLMLCKFLPFKQF